MKKLYIILTVAFLALTHQSCKSDFSAFQHQLLNVASDAKISESEYSSFIATIKTSTDPSFKIFFSDKNTVDDNKVKSYLIKFCESKNIALTSDNIWQAGSNKSSNFNINVYIENSGSMDGYVGENSNFKTTVFNLLTDLKGFKTTDSLNLSYINSHPVPVYCAAARDEIKDFYERLNPRDFQDKGRTASTDLSTMIKQLLDKTNEANLNVFISDCVFSPGKKDAKKYLEGQQAAFKNDFAAALEKTNLSLIILQCFGKFEGTYYNYLDVPVLNIRGERPYYIWFIGTSSQIKTLAANGIFQLIKGGYRNSLVFQSTQEKTEPNYRILLRPQIGSFKLETNARGPITDAEVSREKGSAGKFGFSVAVDYSKCIQDQSYFSDTSNYLLSTNYTMTVSPVDAKNNINFREYTHVLTFQTNFLTPENLKVDVIGRVPQWVYSYSSPDDSKISVNTDQMSKTFGLQYPIEGIADAFYPKNKSNSFCSFSIIIKK